MPPWSTFFMKIECLKLPLPRGWWEPRIFWWGRQNGDWTLIPTSKNKGSGNMWTSLQVPVSTNVSPCHCNWPEWTWLYHLLGPEEALTRMGSGGRTHHNEAYWSQLSSPGHQGHVQRHVPALEATRKRLVQRATEQHLLKEIHDSIKECLQLKWPSILPEAEQRQLPVNTPQPDPSTEFAAANHSMYEKFTATKCDSYKEMMALMRDAHWQAMVAATILKERMERMSSSHICKAPAAVHAPAAANAGDPGPQDVKEVPRWLLTIGNLKPGGKIPRQKGWISTSTSGYLRWLHAKGAPFQGRPSHLVPPGRSARWPSPRGEHPHQLRKAWNTMLERMRPSSCLCQCGRLRRHLREKPIGPWGGQGRRLRSSWSRERTSWRIHCHWNLMSNNC